MSVIKKSTDHLVDILYLDPFVRKYSLFEICLFAFIINALDALLTFSAMSVSSVYEEFSSSLLLEGNLLVRQAMTQYSVSGIIAAKVIVGTLFIVGIYFSTKPLGDSESGELVKRHLCLALLGMSFFVIVPWVSFILYLFSFELTLVLLSASLISDSLGASLLFSLASGYLVLLRAFHPAGLVCLIFVFGCLANLLRDRLVTVPVLAVNQTKKAP